MVIGIDMGHTLSGIGTGASGYFLEVTKNREVGNRLISMLREKGHTVINCTVDYSNNDLYDRTQKANAQRLDLFISIHLNAYMMVTQEMGVETFIYNGNYNGKEANRAKAQEIQNALVSMVGWKDRRVKENNLYVLRETTAPAVLVELGFCDSKGDMDKWNTEVIAKALFKGITGSDYTGNSNSGNSGSSTEQIYRIRKSWSDVASQKGAYRNLDGAKAECNKYPGYSVFDEKGKAVYTNAPKVPTDKEVRRYPERGVATITVDSIFFRDKPTTDAGSTIMGTYSRGESVSYDLVVITEKYAWISWTSVSQGVRRYMPVRVIANGERWVSIV